MSKRSRSLTGGLAKIHSKYLVKRQGNYVLGLNLTAQMKCPVVGGWETIPIVGYQEVQLELPDSWGKMTQGRLERIREAAEDRFPNGESFNAEVKRAHRSSRFYPALTELGAKIKIKDLGGRPVLVSEDGYDLLRHAIEETDMRPDVRADVESALSEHLGVQFS